MKKKIVLISLILLFFTQVFISTVFAEDVGVINFNAINSTNGEKVEDLQVSIYQVSKHDEDGSFIFDIGFENCEIDIDDLSKENLEKLKNFAKSNAEPLFIKNTDTSGKFILENLELGTYLFVQESKQEEIVMQTMLITVPELTVENGLKYELNIKPKIDQIIPEAPDIPLEDKLPATGTLDWLVPILALAGISIFCVAWLKVYTNSKKKVK